MGSRKGDGYADLYTRLVRRSYVADNGCWIWTGTLRTGYGRIETAGLTQSTHIAAYELFVGPVPIGLDLDHLCHNADPLCHGGDPCVHRACWNPWHLDPAPRAINKQRGLLANRFWQAVA